jgi:hypothetical protein
MYCIGDRHGVPLPSGPKIIVRAEFYPNRRFLSNDFNMFFKISENCMKQRYKKIG